MLGAYSSAENMLTRAAVGRETILHGASGGVGLAAVQLAKRRGATVIAICSAAKSDEVQANGADRTIDRGADLVAELKSQTVDVVVDLVGGPSFSTLLEVLRRGGRYAIAGAIGGPIAELDLWTLYLKDLSLFGCTFQEDDVFENPVRSIENGDSKPLVSRIFPLGEIVAAQKAFLSKDHARKIVLTNRKPADALVSTPAG